MSRELFSEITLGGSGGGTGTYSFQDHDGTKHGPFEEVEELTLKSGADSCLKFSTSESGGKLTVGINVYYV